MEFINMTSTGKATIEVDVKEFNRMVLNDDLFTSCNFDEKLNDEELYFEREAIMELANNFKE